MGCQINRPVFDCLACRILPEIIVTIPVVRGPDGPGNEASPAIWANIAQQGICARRVKRALVRTNTRFGRIGRQCLVAILAGRPEFKHINSSADRQAGVAEHAARRLADRRARRGDDVGFLDLLIHD